MRRTHANKGLASRMYKQVWLSFTGLATVPSALVALARRATRPSGEPGQSASAAMPSANVAEGVLVTAGTFTPEAAGFAAKENIQLIDGASLLEKLAALLPEKALSLLKFATKGDFLTPTCPRCSIKMTARKSTGEGRMFWGCTNYPRCQLTFSSSIIAPA